MSDELDPSNVVARSSAGPAPGTLDQLAPLSVLICHCTAGVGTPVAAAVNAAVSPGPITRSIGWLTSVGAASKRSVPLDDATVPNEFENTARYWLPFVLASSVTL